MHAQGYVVLRAVLSEAEVGHALAQIWAMLEGLGSGIRATDPVRSKLSEVLTPSLVTH